MLAKITIRRRPISLSGIKPTHWVHTGIELTGNFKTICSARECCLYVEAIIPIKVKVEVKYVYWYFGCIATTRTKLKWEDTLETKYIPIDTVHIETEHSTYIPTVLKEI